MSSASTSNQTISYWRTFRHYKSRQIVWAQVCLQLVLPLAGGILLRSNGFRVSALSDVLAGLAIITGFLFTLLVFIFQLRLQIKDQAEYSTYASLHRLIDELFAQVNWAIWVSLVSVAATILTLAKLDDAALLSALGTGLFAGVTVHLLAVLFACTQRTRAAYRELLKIQTPNTVAGGN